MIPARMMVLLLLLLKLMPFGEECSARVRWFLYGETLSTGILVAIPSVLSPEPPTPYSLQTSLVHFALPLPEPRVSDYKGDFSHSPFNRLSASPSVSPWQTEALLLFTAGCYLGSFLALVL